MTAPLPGPPPAFATIDSTLSSAQTLMLATAPRLEQRSASTLTDCSGSWSSAGGALLLLLLLVTLVTLLRLVTLLLLLVTLLLPNTKAKMEGMTAGATLLLVVAAASAQLWLKSCSAFATPASSSSNNFFCSSRVCAADGMVRKLASMKGKNLSQTDSRLVLHRCSSAMLVAFSMPHSCDFASSHSSDPFADALPRVGGIADYYLRTLKRKRAGLLQRVPT
jgi:hypothetical protein